MKACKFDSREEKSKKVRKFLEENGDDLPEKAIDEAVDSDMLENFALNLNKYWEVLD